VPQVGIINPSEMAPSKSLDVVVWVAVGGRGTLYGPVIGAILVNLMKSYTTRYFPDYWLIISGALFIFVVLFMPNGVVGLPKQLSGLRDKWTKSRAASRATRRNSPTILMANRPGMLLALESVTKSFDGFKAINDLTFYLDHGEMRVSHRPEWSGQEHVHGHRHRPHPA